MATQPIKQYVVDAFTDHLFAGNPAAVCILDEWLPEATLQNIATENNLSETAFLVKESDAYHLHWFTPGGEIDLCGHATLATAFVVLTFYSEEHNVTFATRSGMLTVQRNGDLFTMDFPAYKLTSVTITPELVNALGVTPQAVFRARNLGNERVQKKDWIAYQASPRGGIMYCTMEDERTRMAGHTILFSKGELYL